MSEHKSDPESEDIAKASDQPSDENLLHGCYQGSEEAAIEIYRRYAPQLGALVRARCSRHLAARLDVDDIVQSVFKSFFRTACTGVYEVPEGKDLWRLLLTIALNKVRAQGRFHRAAKRDVRITTPLDARTPIQTARDWKDEEAEARLRLALAEALEGLPPQQRLLVELRLQGYEVAEISEQVGRSKRTVERGLQKALADLTALFEGDQSDGM